jgi:XTP/dITP diphosphohydrolase
LRWAPIFRSKGAEGRWTTAPAPRGSSEEGSLREIIIATANEGKFREIRKDLSGLFDKFYSLADLPEQISVEEDAGSYAGNAWKKARKISTAFDIGTLADDSGLEVEALGGRPGIYSSRYGATDAERIERLLREMKDVPWEKRKAAFRAYLVFFMPDSERGYIFYGSLEGYIAREMSGGGGFGFDPVFYLPGRNLCLAELSLDEKNSISHRGKALKTFRGFMTP